MSINKRDANTASPLFLLTMIITGLKAGGWWPSAFLPPFPVWKIFSKIVSYVNDHIFRRSVIIGTSFIMIVPERHIIADDITGSVDIICFIGYIGYGKFTRTHSL